MSDDLEGVGEGGDLTPREEAFCRAYGDVESPTYGRGAKSAEVAGYSQQGQAEGVLRIGEGGRREGDLGP
jgi:hypothetical protein